MSLLTTRMKYFQEIIALFYEAQKIGIDRESRFLELIRAAKARNGVEGTKAALEKIHNYIHIWKNRVALTSPLWPAPTINRQPSTPSTYTLGEVIGPVQGIYSYLDVSDFRLGTSITADTGGGKTTLLISIIATLASDPNSTFLLFDNEKHELSLFAHEIFGNDCLIVDMADAKYNIFNYFNLPHSVIINCALANMKAFFPVHDFSESILKTAAIDLHSKLGNYSYEDLFEHIKNCSAIRKTKPQYLQVARQAILTLISNFESARYVRESWKLNEQLEQKKCVVIVPCNHAANAKGFFISNTLGCIKSYRIHKGLRAHNTKNYLFIGIDEAQEPFNKSLYPAHSPSIASIWNFPNEARALNIATVYAFLKPGSCLEPLLSVGNICCTRLRHDHDKRVTAQSLGLSDYTLLGKLPQWTAITCSARFPEPVMVKLQCRPLLVNLHSMSYINMRMKPVLDTFIYTEHIPSAPQNIVKSIQQKDLPQAFNPSENAIRTFNQLSTDPIRPWMTICKAAGITGGACTRVRKKLETYNAIYVHKLSTGEKATLTFAVPTEKGALQFGWKFKPVKGKGSTVHVIGQHAGAKGIKKQGFVDVEVEAFKNGSLLDLHALDREGNSHAWEFILTEGPAEALKQARKALGAECLFVSLVYFTKRRLNSQEKLIIPQLSEREKKAISFKLLHELLPTDWRIK